MKKLYFVSSALLFIRVIMSFTNGKIEKSIKYLYTMIEL